MPLKTWLAHLGFRKQRFGASLHLQLRDLSAALAAEGRTMEEASRQAAREQSLALHEAVDRLEELGLDDVKRSVGALHASVLRELKYTRSLQARRRTTPTLANTHRLVKRLSRIAEAGRPILAGPWTDDVGLELLYWVPFLRWYAGHFHVPPAQLHVVSRGGPSWYAGIAGGYTDIMSVCSGAEFRTQLRASRQGVFRRFDRRIVQHVRRSRVNNPVLLHPGVMYRLLAPYWNHDAPFEHISRFNVPKRLAAPMALPGLPEPYVAARFAFCGSFPDTPANRAWLDNLLESLARSGDVVWLGTGVEGVDGADQSEYVPPAGIRLHHIDRLSKPEHSLAVQAAVIARADAYVGTYGGLAYLAPFYGVKSVAFYSVRNFFPHYRSVAEHVLGNSATLAVVNIADGALLGGVLSAHRLAAS